MPLPTGPKAWIRADADKPLATLLADTLAFTSSDLQRWLELGAVYVNGEREASARELKAQDVVLVHLNPRRFAVSPIRERICFENEDFLVVNKPAGLPVHATCDNARENLVWLLTQEVGPVSLVQRLDIATCGLMVIAKSKPGKAYLHQLIEKRLIEKTYRALVAGPVPTGSYVHWMRPSERAPKEISFEAQPDYKRCELEVQECRTWRDGWQELRIRLVTGRHQQIRAQLAFLGQPIAGDDLYGGARVDWLAGGDESIALQCCGLKFLGLRGEPFSLSLGNPW